MPWESRGGVGGREVGGGERESLRAPVREGISEAQEKALSRKREHLM